ncbi:hypothetical protein, partial [Lentzea indica]|uniref:hypothetical protein n=1 Tax=Lentzea indica TaxID=2604800 RepID=UPI00143A002C
EGRLLDVLVRAHLVDRDRTGRYSMHDLLRAYAAELAAQDEPPERSAAFDRLLDHYLTSTAAAMDVVYPSGGRPPA